MKRRVLRLALGGAVVAAAAAAAFVGSLGPSGATASSHREAPLIADDPAADNTDVYAFVSPDKPNTVTIIANYIPFEDPAGGPNYYRFDPTVLYSLNVDNDGDAQTDVAYEFRFKTELKNPNTFLFNTGPISTPAEQAANLSVRQTYTVTRVAGKSSTVLGSNLPVPPTNIGPRSNPTYDALQGVASLGSDRKVFSGPRDDPFFVDLGTIFDLGGLRPFNSLHVIPLANEAGKDGVKNYNTHTIAIQVPKTDLLKAPMANGNIGIYANASRPKIRILRGDGTFDANGPQVQVSRLGNPLINEVVIPLGKKDYWNASEPKDDAQFLGKVNDPELPYLLSAVYPSVFPDVPDSDDTANGVQRDDLIQVFLTGVPGVNQPTNVTPSEMLRLNMDIDPCSSACSTLGVIDGDLAGFPNGRRLDDDIVDIALRVVEGVLIPGHDSDADTLADGVNSNDVSFQGSFPYVAYPHSGSDASPH